MLAEEKQKLRAEMRSLLKLHDRAEKQKADEKIFQKLVRHSWIQEAEQILCYYSMPDEVETLALISEMLRQGKQVALPVCDRKQKGIMQFHRIENLSSDEVAPRAYGIPAPVRNRGTDRSLKTVIIVPGLAFMQSGERLGQGGGYYDRYLKQFGYPRLVHHDNFHAVGICYDFMLLQHLPFALHDCRVDNVITDK